jgi:hypothetical protein
MRPEPSQRGHRSSQGMFGRGAGISQLTMMIR